MRYKRIFWAENKFSCDDSDYLTHHINDFIIRHTYNDILEIGDYYDRSFLVPETSKWFNYDLWYWTIDSLSSSNWTEFNKCAVSLSQQLLKEYDIKI